MVISTNPKPTIYRNLYMLYENTGWLHIIYITHSHRLTGLQFTVSKQTNPAVFYKWLDNRIYVAMVILIKKYFFSAITKKSLFSTSTPTIT